MTASEAERRSLRWREITRFIDEERSFYSGSWRNTMFFLSVGFLLGFARKRVGVWEAVAQRQRSATILNP